MSYRITSLVAVFVLSGMTCMTTADVLQLPTQTLTGYLSGYTGNSQFISGNLVPVFEADASTSYPPQPAGPLSYAPGDEVTQTVEAPPGKRFVITPGSTYTYLRVETTVAHYGTASAIGGVKLPVTFGGLDGTPPQLIFQSFTTGDSPPGDGLEFSGLWAIPAPFSFTSVTFTGIVPQEKPVVGETFENVSANLYVYEPYPPGSTSDQLLSLQPIPEPMAGVAMAAATLLLRRIRRTARPDAA